MSCVSETSTFDIEQHICEMANIPNVFIGFGWRCGFHLTYEVSHIQM